LDSTKEIDSVEWDKESKTWITKKIQIEEYHGFTECRYCHKPMSHNVKTDGQFKVIYTRCGCSRTD